MRMRLLESPSHLRKGIQDLRRGFPAGSFGTDGTLTGGF